MGVPYHCRVVGGVVGGGVVVGVVQSENNTQRWWLFNLLERAINRYWADTGQKTRTVNGISSVRAIE